MQCRKQVSCDGMTICYDIAIPLRDGGVAMADLYRLDGVNAAPVIMTFGPYGKQQPFQVQTPIPWERLNRETPEVRENTTCRHMTWETVDPEKWTKAGYAVVRVDARGHGRSPGVIDPFSKQEAEDFFDCIEWIGEQSWCKGGVGTLGVSYYAILQWSVAAMHPKHLRAICPWEGANDTYRDQFRKGGILSCNRGLNNNWWRSMILPGQNGMGKRSFLNPVSGLYAGGDQTLSEQELEMNRKNSIEEARMHETEDEFYTTRTARLEDIQVPMLSVGNWGGHNLHLRGNVEGYMQSGSPQKWLDIHGGTHYTDFYSESGYQLQRAFFDHFLKGEENGWENTPPVRIAVRGADESFTPRYENEWPIARTNWTRLYLDPASEMLSSALPEEQSTRSFRAKKESLTFTTPPFEHSSEITGPISVKMFVSSTTRDADLVCVLRLLDEQGKEVTFQGASAPEVPLTMGWLRTSHRKQDEAKSFPWRPWHTHDEIQYIVPGNVYEVCIEILPTCIVVPAGYRLALTVQGHDWDKSRNFQDDPWDKRAELYSGTTTVYGGGETAAFMLVPFIPEKPEQEKRNKE